MKSLWLLVVLGLLVARVVVSMPPTPISIDTQDDENHDDDDDDGDRTNSSLSGAGDGGAGGASLDDATDLAVGEQDDDMDDDDDDDNGDDEPPPSSSFVTEIRAHLEGLRLQPTTVTPAKAGDIRQGSTIALQTSIRYNWLGCSPYCKAYRCPRMYFDHSDWSQCRGEVFRIYRSAGPGSIRVGDYVGLYYPVAHGHRWFGCSSTYCGKYSCPGRPTMRYGFQTEEKWYQCGGEVFRIYAKGKRVGWRVKEGDDVMFYYVEQPGRWVSQVTTQRTRKRTCPGYTKPPSHSRYDRCGAEVFKIWRK